MIYLFINNEIVDSKDVEYKTIENTSNDMFFFDIVNSRVKDSEDYKIVSLNHKSIMRIYTYVHYYDRVNNQFANILYKSANSMSKNLHKLIVNYEIKRRLTKLNKINA